MIIRLFQILLVFIALINAVDSSAALEDVIGVQNGVFFLKASDTPLRRILETINEKYSIDVRGLDSRADDKITFSFQAPTSEGLLKGLLRHLGIKNYAFEFADDKIRRVMIIVGSGKEISIPEAPQTEPSAKKEFVSVAEIQSVLDSSQAKSLGLLEGDLIIEYDGVRIRSAQQLVSEVEKKSSQNQIEMIVIREKIPMRLILSGGFVGVKVMTRNIPQEDLNQVFPSE